MEKQSRTFLQAFIKHWKSQEHERQPHNGSLHMSLEHPAVYNTQSIVSPSWEDMNCRSINTSGDRNHGNVSDKI